MKLNEYGQPRAIKPADKDIKEGLSLMTCLCSASVHLVRYVGCKPDVPLYHCEYGELHQGLDPNPYKEV
jgi:hypothetical protein